MNEPTKNSPPNQMSNSEDNFIENAKDITAHKQTEPKDIYEFTNNLMVEKNRLNAIVIQQEHNRRLALFEQLHKQFRVVGSNFHFNDQPQTVAFKDKGERIVSASNDDRVAQAMVTMAEAKGWKSIKVSGHSEFQRQIWMEANTRGIDVYGYKPTEQDLKQLEDRRNHTLPNAVALVPTLAEQNKAMEARSSANHILDKGEVNVNHAASVSTHQNFNNENKVPSVETAVRAYTGRVLNYGEDNYNHDPKESKSYFVTLETDKGEKTVWGVDLSRGMSEEEVKKGDHVTLEFKGSKTVTVKVPQRDEKGEVIDFKEIETARNTWDVQKSDKAKVIEAVASTLIDSTVKDPRQREALKGAIEASLIEREKTGQVPTVSIYDKNSPAKSPSQERTDPRVEHNIERTR